MKGSARYTVTIAGQTFSLVSDESKESVDAICALVNDVMQGLSPTVSGSRTVLTTLAALKIANELHKERQRSTQVDVLHKQLINFIDSAIE